MRPRALNASNHWHQINNRYAPLPPYSTRCTSVAYIRPAASVISPESVLSRGPHRTGGAGGLKRGSNADATVYTVQLVLRGHVS
ncbi:Hypothetical protein SMAX5B_019295 [Scophthalmus maximus]|uniref:Uncharacterized protein n=1 Tax=Scophthalmus maximus TaxID=52904 RepID=A0A2U9BTT4_SCOMX|nr:Hypothetical protein SMAX5B_019295 [Scophthalmus maximus]